MQLEGTLSDLQTFGSWGKGRLSTRDGSVVNVVGEALVGLANDREYVLEGESRLHERYGAQFKVRTARFHPSLGLPRILDDLQALYAGCGDKTARKVASAFEAAPNGLGALAEILAERPWELEDPGVAAGARLKYLGEVRPDPKTRVARTLNARMHAYRLPEALLSRVVSWLEKTLGGIEAGSESVAVDAFMADPYKPCLEVDGYDFMQAEAVAKALEVPWNHSSRLAALAYHAIHSFCWRHGHTFMTTVQFAHALRRLEQRATPQECLEAAAERTYPLQREQTRLYLESLLDAEKQVAVAIAKMLDGSVPLWHGTLADLGERIDSLQDELGYALDDSQRRSVIGILTSRCRLHTLTAGPGCGKTTVMEVVAALVPDVRFAAPTGNAAKVLSSRVQKYAAQAQTVHAMLEANGESFGRNESEPLVANLIVVDEAGMEDLYVCAALVQSMPRHTHLLLVGDLDQLDSVGPGRVLADVTQLPEADHHGLEVPHRADTGILNFIDAVRQGALPENDDGESVRYVGFDSNTEINFEEVTDLWLECVEERGLEGVALLFPYRKGSAERPGLNVTYANATLQSLVNPLDDSNAIPATSLRREDRVVVRKNLTIRRWPSGQGPEASAILVNGDSGYVRSFSLKEGRLDSVQLRMDDAREVTLPAQHLPKVDLAYALTVHSAQGKEFDTVIFCLTGKESDFLSRRLLYTGCSRAKKQLVVIGKRAEVERIAQFEPAPRQSWLAMRVQELREQA